MFSATYQFSRGVQTGGAGPSILGDLDDDQRAFLAANGSTLGRNLNAGSATKTVQLIREGLEYGDQNLSQLDLRASKRFTVGRYRFRIDFDLYNVFNSNWPYTVNTTFSTARRRAPGCGRPTRSTAGCSRSAGSSTSSRSFGRARRMAPARPHFSFALDPTFAGPKTCSTPQSTAREPHENRIIGFVFSCFRARLLQIDSPHEAFGSSLVALMALSSRRRRAAGPRHSPRSRRCPTSS